MVLSAPLSVFAVLGQNSAQFPGSSISYGEGRTRLFLLGRFVGCFSSPFECSGSCVPSVPGSGSFRFFFRLEECETLQIASFLG
jgi:hypothetical protein